MLDMTSHYKECLDNGISEIDALNHAVYRGMLMQEQGRTTPTKVFFGDKQHFCSMRERNSHLRFDPAKGMANMTFMGLELFLVNRTDFVGVD